MNRSPSCAVQTLSLVHVCADTLIETLIDYWCTVDARCLESIVPTWVLFKGERPGRVGLAFSTSLCG